MAKVKYTNYLPVISIIVTIFSSDTLAIILVMSGLLLYLFSSKVHYNISFADSLFFAYFLAASLVYLRLRLDIKEYTTIVFFPYLLYLYINTVPIQINSITLIKLLLIATAIYSILMFFRDINGNFTLSLDNNIFRTQRQVDDSMTVGPNKFFKNATNMAIWLVCSFILSFILFKHTHKKLYLISYLFFLALVFFSNTRSAMGCCLIVLFVNFFTLKKRGTFYFLIFCIVVIPLSYFLLSFLSISQFQAERITAIFDSKQDYGLDNRLSFWSMAFVYISKNYWGYGHTYLFNQIGRSTHNDYIGQLMAVGIIPSLFFFGFIFHYFFKFYKNLKNNNDGSNYWVEISFYLLVTYILTSITEQVSASNRIWMAILFLSIGYSKKAILKETIQKGKVYKKLANNKKIEIN